MAEDAHGTDVAEPQSVVVVRYWAAARAAAGVETDSVQIGSGMSLSTLLRTVLDRHADRPRLQDVVAVCSILVGDRPVNTSDPNDVVLHAGDTVELLPPFAGG